MSLAVVIPHRDNGCDHRDAALGWTVARWRLHFPDTPIVFGECDPDQPFNRSAAILDGAQRTDAQVLIVADGDCWTDGIHEALRAMAAGASWAVPHLKLHRLTEEATARVLAGAEPSTSMKVQQSPYRGYDAGTALCIRRDVVLNVPPDVRLVGWGQDDEVWASALRTLVGPPWRVTTAPLFHCWHPPQERKTRSIGSVAGKALLDRYKAAKTPDAMRALIDEGRQAWTQPA